MQIEIVGPRGSGKTTFANALLAAPVLPYFVGSPRAPPTVSIARCSVNYTGAKNFMHAAKVLLDGRVHQVPGSGGSLSLQLEALAGHDQVDRIHVELASDLSPSETATVTENHVPPPLAPPEPSTLRVLVARWEYLEVDADKYLRANGLRDGLLIVNMNQTESSSSLSLDEVRALASTRLGVEARSVFAVNARLALANALLQEAAPATTIPHQGALQSIKHKVASWMAAKSTSSNGTAAGPRYRVESATSSSAAATQVAAPDRYVPSVFQPFHMESPPPQRPPRSSRNDGSDDVSNVDRYELVARRDARMVVEGLNFQYTPKVTAP